jgi:hypothetical protein
VAGSAGQTDPRAARAAAAMTTAVLTTSLILQGRAGLLLVAWQLTVFTISATAGARYSPYIALLNALAKPDRSRSSAGEDRGSAPEREAGPRLAQTLGATMLTAALALSYAGRGTAAWAIVATVTALSALLATLNICVACHLYGLSARLKHTLKAGTPARFARAGRGAGTGSGTSAG